MVLEQRERGAQLPVGRPALHGQAPLAGSRQHLADPERMRVLATDAEPVESGGGEDHGVDVAGVELPQPRGDVAAEVGHLHTRMGCQELRPPADR